MQCGDFIASRTVHPDQTRPPRLWAVTDMLKDQPEIAKPAGHAAKLLDCVGYGSFVPRRHKREVNIGWFDQPDRHLFKRRGKLGEFSRDLRRDPQPHKNALLRSVRSLCVFCPVRA